MSDNKKSLKELSPDTFVFFKDYWEFISQYWKVPAGTDEDWWNCFQSDLNKILEKYDESTYFNDVVMAFYDRCLHVSEHTETA